MLAYHNDPAIKEKYLSRVIAHRKADEIIKGTYWKEGEDGVFRGCAVGCTLHSSDHSAYETELGIPRILARLEDGIFEELPESRCKTWPQEFLSAITPGADLSNVWPQFAVWLLSDEKYGVLPYAKTDEQRNAIQTIIDYYRKYKTVTIKQWKAAAAYAAAAYAAADAAYSDAAYAAAAAAADAAYAAYADDAYAAADAYSAAAAYAAYAADAADAAAANARSECRLAQADKLLQLLREAN